MTALKKTKTSSKKAPARARSKKKASKARKSRTSSKKAPQPLLTPSEGQKVKLAVGLLLVFLVGFSLATGALEIGKWNDGWRVSAVDTEGQCRVRLVLYKDRKPEMKVF